MVLVNVLLLKKRSGPIEVRLFFSNWNANDAGARNSFLSIIRYRRILAPAHRDGIARKMLASLCIYSWGTCLAAM